MRRKQASIRSSRSALPHRYLRYISWISWKGVSPLQAGFLPVFHPVSHPVRPPTTKSRIQLRSCCCCRHPEEKENIYWSFPEKKKNILLLFFHAPLACRSSCVALPASPTRAACGPSAAGPSRRLLRPSHKQKNAGPRHCAANPLITKSVDFSLKKTHVGTPGFHALASAARTYSSTARIHYHSFSFLLFYKEKKKENRSKFSRFEYIARTHFVRPHDVRDWPVAPRPLKFM